MADHKSPDGDIDFDAAETFLMRAREAYETGDEKTCMASLKLVAIALCLREGPNGQLHTGHLGRL